jgi:predicted dienelactone hydrolase
MRTLIDELSEDAEREAILRVKLRFPASVTIDLSKLIVCGHSFGGMTALEVAV